MTKKNIKKSEALKNYLAALELSIAIPNPPFNATPKEYDAWQERIREVRAEVMRCEAIWKDLK